MRFLHAFWRVVAPAALLLTLLALATPAGAQLTPLGPQFQVNPVAPLANEAFASIASDAAGNFVVVWRQVLPGPDAYGIYARRYDANAQPLAGPIQVHEQPASVVTETGVAMDADGDFVVVWTSSPNPGDPEGPFQVKGRRFDRTGAAQGGELSVGEGSLPDVAMEAAGGFVVVWQRLVEGRSFVFGRLYSAAGAALGPEFPVSLEPSASLAVPRVDREADGDFAVVWQEDDPDDSLAAGTVKLRLYESSGASLAGPVVVGDLAEAQDRPDVAFGHDGEAFVVWRRGNGIFGRLYDAAGVPRTDALKLDSGAPQFSSVAENPRVASDAAGRFLAVWSNRVGPAAQNQDIYGRLVDQEGRLLGDEVRITTTPAEGDHQLRPAVAGQPAGFVVIWEDRFNKVLGQRLGQTAGALRFREAGTLVREGASSVIVFVERGGQGGAVSVSYRTQNGTAVAGEDFVATTGTLQWAEGDSAPKPITVPLISDRFQEEQRETFSIVLENPVGGATLGEPSRLTVTVLDDDGLPTPLGGEIEAAAEDAGEGFLEDPDVAMDPTAASGRFALVWTDRPLTALPVVRGRLWLGEGTPLPPVFDIGAGVTPGVIWTSQGLTVVWASLEGRIEGRRLTEGGSPQGGAFRINDRSEESRRPAIAANPQGGAVVVWEGIDPANRDRFGVDVLARRLNAAGQPVGPEFAVGSNRPGVQLNPDVAVAPDGSFVVVWQSRSTRTFSTEIIARRFSREGVALGAEFQVNTAAAGEQMRPSVAVDPSGSFFVVWDSLASDTGTEDVFGQLFDAQGRKIGRDFRINTFATGRQLEPRVESQLLGGYVVVWTSGWPTGEGQASAGQDGDTFGVFGQRYDGRGRPFGAEFQANADPVGSQSMPAVSTGRAGTFVVAWRTLLANLDTRIEAQRFSSASVCLPTDTTLCLGNGRFQVRASWDTGVVGGQGKAVGLSNETGFFWFFSPDNVEMIVKALDGCGVNQRFWVFSGGLTNVEVELEVTDVATGAVRTYTNPQGTAFLPIQDTAAFPTCDVPGPGGPVLPLPEPTACGNEPAAISLAGGRFQVDVEWATPDGQTGRGRGVQLTADTGYFCFFSPDNVEVVVKVLDGCPVNRRFWVFSGGLTNVQVRMTVTDTLRGETRTYTNPQGRAFLPVQDTSAFATCQ